MKKDQRGWIVEKYFGRDIFHIAIDGLICFDKVNDDF